MKNKILFSALFSIIIAFSTVVCFANTSKEKTDMKGLGNEITSSIKETEENVDNFVNMDTLNRNNDKNMENNGIMEGAENAVRELGNDVENTTNKAVAGITGNYNAGETITTDGMEMSRNTWIWIIMAVLAVVIVASVWYYAAQRND